MLRTLQKFEILRRETGQTMSEYAVVLGGVVLGVIGAIGVFSTAGAGRFNNVGTTTAAKQSVRDAASTLDQSKLNVDVTDPTWGTAGSLVTVTATYPYEINIPLLGMTLSSGTLTAVAKERLE